MLETDSSGDPGDLDTDDDLDIVAEYSWPREPHANHLCVHPSVARVKHVALGEKHMLALCVDHDGYDRVYVAGSNKWGQLGIDPAAGMERADAYGEKSKAFLGQMRPLNLDILEGADTEKEATLSGRGDQETTPTGPQRRILGVACGERHSMILVELKKDDAGSRRVIEYGHPFAAMGGGAEFVMKLKTTTYAETGMSARALLAQNDKAFKLLEGYHRGKVYKLEVPDS